jgi:hypothetical protein
VPLTVLQEAEMSDADWLEVRYSVEAMLINLERLAHHNPEAPIRGEDFDAVLQRAQAAFPHSAAIRDVKKIGGVTTLADAFAKLSILQGAVKAAFAMRNVEEMAKLNEENRRRRRGTPRYGN